jgi:hypothetical protein
VPDGAEVAAGTREVPHWPEPEPELEPELEPEVDIFSTQQKSKACHCRYTPRALLRFASYSTPESQAWARRAQKKLEAEAE